MKYLLYIRHIGIFTIYFYLFYFFTVLVLTERERNGGWGRERDTEDPKWALRWQQRAWRGAWTHHPWDHDLSQSWIPNWPRHPGAPSTLEFLKSINLRSYICKDTSTFRFVDSLHLIFCLLYSKAASSVIFNWIK